MRFPGLSVVETQQLVPEQSTEASARFHPMEWGTVEDRLYIEARFTEVVDHPLVISQS